MRKTFSKSPELRWGFAQQDVNELHKKRKMFSLYFSVPSSHPENLTFDYFIIRFLVFFIVLCSPFIMKLRSPKMRTCNFECAKSLLLRSRFHCVSVTREGIQLCLFVNRPIVRIWSFGCCVRMVLLEIYLVQ